MILKGPSVCRPFNLSLTLFCRLKTQSFTKSLKQNITHVLFEVMDTLKKVFGSWNVVGM